jgi:hypothetical protein
MAAAAGRNVNSRVKGTANTANSIDRAIAPPSFPPRSEFGKPLGPKAAVAAITLLMAAPAAMTDRVYPHQMFPSLSL